MLAGEITTFKCVEEMPQDEQAESASFASDHYLNASLHMYIQQRLDFSGTPLLRGGNVLHHA